MNQPQERAFVICLLYTHLVAQGIEPKTVDPLDARLLLADLAYSGLHPFLASWYTSASFHQMALFADDWQLCRDGSYPFCDVNG